MRNWPAMTILAVDCTWWTTDSEKHISAGTLPEWFDQNVDQLVGLTDMVRGKLTNQERLTLGALIVIDVHARDTIQLLIDVDIKFISDFDWVSQVREWVMMPQSVLGDTERACW